MLFRSERSSQEIERAFREASADFERELERGNALLRVKEAVASVEAASSNLYHEFQQEFEAQVKKFSGGKYQKSSMKEALPSEFHRADGAAIPYSWLSAGTKDSFALVLRLSMAARFLGASNGFVMMDDPLVNMDGDRQKIAAEVLGQFSRDRQVILFTCHAQHASLLGGHLIEL